MTRTRGARERRWRGGAAQLEGASPGEELEVEDESGRERGGGAVSMVVFMCSLDKSSADDGFYDILYLLIFFKKYANSFDVGLLKCNGSIFFKSYCGGKKYIGAGSK